MLGCEVKNRRGDCSYVQNVHTCRSNTADKRRLQAFAGKAAVTADAELLDTATARHGTENSADSPNGVFRQRLIDNTADVVCLED